MNSVTGPLLFALLVMLAVAVAVVAVWRLSRGKDNLGERLDEFGATAYQPASEEYGPGDATLRRKRSGGKLAAKLAAADLPMTVTEFSLLRLGGFALGFLFGSWRAGLFAGLALGAVLSFAPIFYLGAAIKKRQRAFTEQLPDVLTLLVGALRAGYGLSQALTLLVEQLPKPASVEFGRVMRAVNLGQSVEQALNDMAVRVGTDDLDLVITAINIQHEMGGNLAQTLDIIGETVRDRIRMLREIRVMTAQQRYTGYVLAFLPVGLGTALFFMNPSYMGQLFAPGWIFLPIFAGMLMVVGFFVIRRIVDIEV